MKGTKFEKLGEIYKFVDIYNLPRLNHIELENLSGLITSKKIETVMKNLFKKQKSMSRWLYWSILTNIQRRVHISTSQTLPRKVKQ